MTTKRSALKILLVFAFLLSLPCSIFAKAPKYVFLFIGDGMGISHRHIAELYHQEKTGNKNAKLLINSLTVTGINTTGSADSYVTKSCAAGTALATGYKTNKHMIGMLPDKTKLKTILDAAKEKGWTTGVVTTDAIVGATPAAFLAHNGNRYNYNEIAQDVVYSGVDFIAGNGYGIFTAKNSGYKSLREDDKNLVSELKNIGYKTFIGEDSSDNFRNFVPNKKEKVFAAFSFKYPPYEIDRAVSNTKTPTLTEMTEKAIETLAKQKKPFFLMIEGAKIDDLSHVNDICALLPEIMEFENAVKTAYKFYQKHPKETLIIVTADHETGGLGLGHPDKYYMSLEPITKAKTSFEAAFTGFWSRDLKEVKEFIKENFGLDNLTEEEEKKLIHAVEAEKLDPDKKYEYVAQRPISATVLGIVLMRAGIGWTIQLHTAEPVVLTAEGVGAKRFVGFMDNTDVSKILADLLGFKLSKF
ncbi:MAG TPA: alkaline phosphatase [Elusimicrobiales bacterium]|nr:alkaline phosphatase [Elusimicrobiales bacterium]